MPETINAETEFTVPSEKVVRSIVEAFQKEMRPFVKLPPNLAKNDELAEEIRRRAHQKFERFAHSQARTDLETYLKNADAKYRIASDQDLAYKTDSSQEATTMSHVASIEFYKNIKLISAGQKQILFSDPDELPAKYCPVQKSDDYDSLEGQRIAAGQNTYLRFVWQKEYWTDLIKRGIVFNNKNSMDLWELAWDFTQEMRPERVPGWYDSAGKPVEWTPAKDNRGSGMYDSKGESILPDAFLDEAGMPTSFVFIEKLREKRNWPVLTRHDLRNAFFDLQLNNLQDSTCIVIRDQCTFGELLSQEKNGFYTNVGALTTEQLFSNESKHGLDTLSNRYDNASTTLDDGIENGLFDRYHVWILAPIKDWEDADKAAFDGEGLPILCEAVFVGPFEETIQGVDESTKKRKGCVCVQLRHTPYHHNRFPYYLMHSLDDEKGLVHMGYYTLLECLLEEENATVNQWIDNKTLAIRSPFIAEKGNFLERTAKFFANKILWVKPGTGRTALTKLEVPNITQRTVEELPYIKQQMKDVVGVVDAVSGNYAGSRTTATEVLGAREQAIKPALEDCKTVFVPFLTWLLEGVADLSRQFAPNKTHVLTDSEGQFVGEVNPTLLYGQLATKVIAIDNFESDLSGRQILVNFIQAGGYDRAKEFMGKDGGLHFWRTVAKRLRLPEPTKLFPESKPYVEAVNQANADYRYILINPADAIQNEMYLPKQGEAHDIHIATLQPYSDQLTTLLPTLSEEEREQYTLVKQAVDFYIMRHEQLKAQEQMSSGLPPPTAMLGAGTAGMGGNQMAAPMQAAQTPAMPGEAAGDMMSGIGQQMGGA